MEHGVRVGFHTHPAQPSQANQTTKKLHNLAFYFFHHNRRTRGRRCSYAGEGNGFLC